MVDVTKANGEIEPFSEEKVRASIERAGISRELEQKVISHVKSKLYERIPTSEVYKHINEFLGASPEPFLRAKYSLKQAIMAMGPTGYPFEDYVASILQHLGYSTKVRQLLLGKCITHEIDVLAEKKAPPRKRISIEAKFHNMPGTKTDVHVALYTKARFDDIKAKHRLNEAWLVTNTKITQDAITYAECNNIKAVTWSYPKGESLRELVEKFNLAPITVLNELSANQILALFSRGVVLCKDIAHNPSILEFLGLPKEKEERIIEEAKFVLGGRSTTRVSEPQLTQAL